MFMPFLNNGERYRKGSTASTFMAVAPVLHELIPVPHAPLQSGVTVTALALMLTDGCAALTTAA
jgi:hypothetical protein